MSKYHSIMMKTAKLFANESSANRRKVGAVLARDGRILATGYNGTIVGRPNICEEFIPFDVYHVLEQNEKIINCPSCNNGKIQSTVERSWSPERCFTCDGVGKLIILDKTSQFTVHAEQNIITYCAKEGISTKGATLYVTTAPCRDCAKLIVQAGISEIFYNEQYKLDGLEFLRECGIIANQMD